MQKVRIGTLELGNPLMPASGTFGFGYELADRLPVNRLGALVTKAVTLKPRQGNPPPRAQETPCGILNSVGLENPGLEVFLADILPRIRRIGPPIVVNIAGERGSDYLALVEAFDSADGVSVLEVNVSCPNVEGGTEFGRNHAALEGLVRDLRLKTNKPLWVKLTPFLTDVVSEARAAERGGADALVIANTYKGLWVRDDGSEFIGGLSGPAIMPISLFLVREVSRVVGIPVIGVGGIRNAADVRRYLSAGAVAVQVGTGNLVDPACMFRILDELG
ncbi:MAG: dihydroorotate dehydrogenase [candidate division WOR-3 bacterium]